MGLRSGLCDGHSNTFLPQPYEVCLGSLSIWLMPWDGASIYPHNFLSSWRHLFCEVHQSLLCFTVGMVFFGLQASPFSSKHSNGHYGQTIIFLFRQTRGHFSKKYNLCPHVQLQTVVCFFMAVLEQWLFPCWAPFRLCLYGTCFTVDIDTFVPVSSSIFIRSFAVVVGLICTFCTKVR